MSRRHSQVVSTHIILFPRYGHGFQDVLNASVRGQMYAGVCVCVYLYIVFCMLLLAVLWDLSFLFDSTWDIFSGLSRFILNIYLFFNISLFIYSGVWVVLCMYVCGYMCVPAHEWGDLRLMLMSSLIALPHIFWGRIFQGNPSLQIGYAT